METKTIKVMQLPLNTLVDDRDPETVDAAKNEFWQWVENLSLAHLHYFLE
jgi:hypothetical protein